MRQVISISLLEKIRNLFQVRDSKSKDELEQARKNYKEGRAVTAGSMSELL